MNRKKFERYLIEHGCFLHHHGGGHDSWCRYGLPKLVSLPRHNEIDPSIVRSVCRTLGIPKPPEK